RAAPRPRGRRQPADRRPHGPRSRRPNARPPRGWDRTGARRTVLPGLDRRTGDRRGGRRRGGGHPDDRHADPDERRRRAPAAGRGCPRRSRMKVAIVGGTGSFGRALARKLRSLDHEVYVGSRDAQRGRERAIELGVQGGANEEVVRGADLVVLATKSNATLDTARELVDAIGETPVLCVASDLVFTDAGVLPGRDERSLAEDLAEIVRAPVASGLQSLSATHLGGSEPPDQDALVCGEDSRAKELALEIAGRLVAGRAIDVGPRPNSRALEAMTAVILNVNREFGVNAGLRLTGIP